MIINSGSDQHMPDDRPINLARNEISDIEHGISCLYHSVNSIKIRLPWRKLLAWWYGLDKLDVFRVNKLVIVDLFLNQM